MTSYFDDHTHEVSQAAHTRMDDAAFLSFISDVEHQVIREVSLVTGDREFPPDLREKIQGIIALYRTTPVGDVEPTPRSVQLAKALRICPVLPELHRAFHTVATRRIETRFGVLSDHPGVNLAMRDDYEENDPRGDLR